MLKRIPVLILILSCIICISCATSQEQRKPRKIAVQMWTTHDYTLEESIVGLAKLGIKSIETTPIQKISKKYGKTLFDHNMNSEQREYVKRLLKDNDMQICAIYCRPPKDENDLKNLMEFGKFFGVNLYVSESKPDMLPLWEKYCGIYNAKMAIHCHQRGTNTPYWDPQVIKALVKDYRHIGFCAETGAWSRSGVDPVSALKIAEGKIYALHLKDQKTFNDLKSEGVNYGTGVLDMKAILAELDRQNFDSWYVIEQGDDQKNAFEIVKINAEYLKNN